ncbi:MAG: hypothetical protein M3Z23_06190, partial [Acidobacteriota bacterium]|nr:hypothetical protein [Acidobacteriota bacterium]
MNYLNRLSIVFTVAAAAFCAEPLSFQKSIQEGRGLSPENAAKLETALQSNPEDADSRARLLGYYSGLETSGDPDAAASARAGHL